MCSAHIPIYQYDSPLFYPNVPLFSISRGALPPKLQIPRCNPGAHSRPIRNNVIYYNYYYYYFIIIIIIIIITLYLKFIMFKWGQYE